MKQVLAKYKKQVFYLTTRNSQASEKGKQLLGSSGATCTTLKQRRWNCSSVDEHVAIKLRCVLVFVHALTDRSSISVCVCVYLFPVFFVACKHISCQRKSVSVIAYVDRSTDGLMDR